MMKECSNQVFGIRSGEELGEILAGTWKIRTVFSSDMATVHPFQYVAQPVVFPSPVIVIGRVRHPICFSHRTDSRSQSCQERVLRRPDQGGLGLSSLTARLTVAHGSCFVSGMSSRNAIPKGVSRHCFSSGRYS